MHGEPIQDALDQDVIPVGPEHVVARKRCAVCLAPMALDSPTCSRCAYDERKGLRSSTFYERIRTGKLRDDKICRKCKYPLKDVRGGRCPECATPFGPAAAQYRRRKIEKVQATTSWLRIALLFVGGLLGVFAVLALSGEANVIPLYLTRFAIRVPIVYVAFIMCSIIWIGFDEPLHVTTAKFVSIFPLIDLAGMLSYLFFTWLLVGGLVDLVMLHRWAQIVVMFALLKEVVDVDIEDAGILALLLMVVYAATSMLILHQPGLI